MGPQPKSAGLTPRPWSACLEMQKLTSSLQYSESGGLNGPVSLLKANSAGILEALGTSCWLIVGSSSGPRSRTGLSPYYRHECLGHRTAVLESRMVEGAQLRAQHSNQQHSISYQSEELWSTGNSVGGGPSGPQHSL